MLSDGVKLAKDIELILPSFDMIYIYLERPDFTTAVNMAESINREFFGSAFATDPATIKIHVPKSFRDENRINEFIRAIEQIRFQPDFPARVVFNERTGTIIIGGEIKLSSVAISHGNITVNIKNVEGVSQPPPFSSHGTTERVNDQQTNVDEEKPLINLLPEITTIADLVDLLNALGVTPREIMIIFHLLKESGALHAEIVAI